MKNKILIAVTLFVCTVASSCNNWLDVTPRNGLRLKRSAWIRPSWSKACGELCRF